MLLKEKRRVYALNRAFFVVFFLTGALNARSFIPSAPPFQRRLNGNLIPCIILKLRNHGFHRFLSYCNFNRLCPITGHFSKVRFNQLIVIQKANMENPIKISPNPYEKYPPNLNGKPGDNAPGPKTLGAMTGLPKSEITSTDESQMPFSPRERESAGSANRTQHMLGSIHRSNNPWKESICQLALVNPLPSMMALFGSFLRQLLQYESPGARETIKQTREAFKAEKDPVFKVRYEVNECIKNLETYAIFCKQHKIQTLQDARTIYDKLKTIQKEPGRIDSANQGVIDDAKKMIKILEINSLEVAKGAKNTRDPEIILTADLTITRLKQKYAELYAELYNTHATNDFANAAKNSTYAATEQVNAILNQSVLRSHGNLEQESAEVLRDRATIADIRKAATEAANESETALNNARAAKTSQELNHAFQIRDAAQLKARTTEALAQVALIRARLREAIHTSVISAQENAGKAASEKFTQHFRVLNTLVERSNQILREGWENPKLEQIAKLVLHAHRFLESPVPEFASDSSEFRLAFLPSSLENGDAPTILSTSQIKEKAETALADQAARLKGFVSSPAPELGSDLSKFQLAFLPSSLENEHEPKILFRDQQKEMAKQPLQ